MMAWKALTRRASRSKTETESMAGDKNRIRIVGDYRSDHPQWNYQLSGLSAAVAKVSEKRRTPLFHLAR